MKRRLSTNLAAGVAALGLALTAGCSAQENDSASTTGTGASSKYNTVKPGVISVATSSDLTPFAYIKDGEWQGYDVMLLKHAAKKIGLEVAIKAQEFDTILPNVAAHQADLAMGSIADTDERRKTVDFTLPDIIGNNTLIAPSGSAIKTEDDVAGKRIGILQSSQALQFARKYWKQAKIVTFPTNNAARVALAAENLDAVLLDPQTAERYTKQYSLHKVLAAVNPEDRGGAWAINKKEDGLRKALNKQLKIALKNGTMKKLYEKWVPAGSNRTVFGWLKKYYSAHPSNGYSE